MCLQCLVHTQLVLHDSFIPCLEVICPTKSSDRRLLELYIVLGTCIGPAWRPQHWAAELLPAPHVREEKREMIIIMMITLTVPHTLTCAASMLSSSKTLLSGDGDATIVERGLWNCDAAGDFVFVSVRRDDTELAVCRLTAESMTHQLAGFWYYRTKQAGNPDNGLMTL